MKVNHRQLRDRGNAKQDELFSRIKTMVDEEHQDIGVTAGGTVLVTEGNRETGSSSPILCKYTNSSTNAVSIVLKARQLFQCDQQLMYNNPSSSYLTNWIHVKEVKR